MVPFGVRFRWCTRLEAHGPQPRLTEFLDDITDAQENARP